MNLRISGIGKWYQFISKEAEHEERDVETSGIIRNFQAPEAFARGAEIPAHTLVSHAECRAEPEQRAGILCCNFKHHTLPNVWDDKESK